MSRKTMNNNQQTTAFLYEGDFCYAQVPVECDITEYKKYLENIAQEYSIVDFRVEFMVELNEEV